MADFNVRSDSVNVEQIMEQIRARIREKRGVDYTEQQIRELAAVKLEKFLDPRTVRSDLLDQFRRSQAPYSTPVVPTYAFEDTTMFETHRGPLRFIRKLLAPLLKLFFNPNAIVHALHTQAEINRVNLEREVQRENQRRDLDALTFEVIHNLVFELTRTGIEVKNLKMQVESLAGRLEFNERRARALESAVVYKPEAPTRSERAEHEPRRESPERPAPRPAPAGAEAAPPTGQPAGAPAEGPGQRSRRRRRRRGRRGGGAAQTSMTGAPVSGSSSAPAGDEMTAPGSPPDAGNSRDLDSGFEGNGADTAERAENEVEHDAAGGHRSDDNGPDSGPDSQ